MRVLSVLPAPASPSGLIFARRQIASLGKLGVESRIITIPSKNVTFGNVVRSFMDLRKNITDFDPDLVHVHYGVLYAFLAAFSNRKPLVITFQGSDINTLKTKSFLRNFYSQALSNLAVLRADLVICVSRNLMRNLVWGKKKVVIIPPGINLEEFRVMDKSEARNALNWNKEDRVILFNANNPPVKRLDLALETLDILKKEMPGVRLEILDGTAATDEQIPVILNASDVLLICSDSEGSPTMVKEALACNVAVIGVDVGDVVQRLEGVNRCRVVEKDPGRLAKALKEVFGSAEPVNGREKLMSDGLSEEQVAEKIFRVYQKLLS